MIGDSIVVTVLAVHGLKVKLGVAAPDDTPIHREEIFIRIHGKPAAETLPVDPKMLDSAEPSV
jgi:carbon storage regulator